MTNESDKRAAFLDHAATRLSFTGALVQERRLIPEKGYRLEQGKEKNTILLRRRAGDGPTTTVSCTCGLEGGGCDIVIVNPDDVDQYAVCVPSSGCGTSGLFCFMDSGFSGGLPLRFRM